MEIVELGKYKMLRNEPLEAVAGLSTVIVIWSKQKKIGGMARILDDIDPIVDIAHQLSAVWASDGHATIVGRDAIGVDEARLFCKACGFTVELVDSSSGEHAVVSLALDGTCSASSKSKKVAVATRKEVV